MRALPAGFAATYSIVARDAATGQLGVAVQSNYFSVGTDISWAEAGVGAVATQSLVEVSYGPRGLQLLAQGASATQALERLVRDDAGAAMRQIAIVDARGSVAGHSGAACIPACGQHFGAGYAAQGNLLRSDAVWQAMGPAFERTPGDLAERLMAALEAAEAAGGDVRGPQSAALLVVGAERPANPWEGRLVDLHVEHHPRPLEELRRLLTVRRAHALFEEARRQMASGALDAAVATVEQALRLKPDDAQFRFWLGVALANAGRDRDARPWLEQAFAADPGWRELARRLVPFGMFPARAELLES
jgi:uncharacterized Ntn-hydrolase superfamily protein